MTRTRANAAFAHHAFQFEPTKLTSIRVNQVLIGTLFLRFRRLIPANVNILVSIEVLLSVLVIVVLGVLVILGSWGVAF
ncbi:MAG: hypothetical protein AAF267_09340 [Deinococcota bacterium]